MYGVKIAFKKLNLCTSMCKVKSKSFKEQKLAYFVHLSCNIDFIFTYTPMCAGYSF